MRPKLRRALVRVMGGVFASALAIGAWNACSIYDTSLLLPAPAPPSEDGGFDAPIDSPVTPENDADTCAHAGWPARPANDDPSATPDVRVVNALRTLDIGQRTDDGVGPLFGVDLDGTCTCPGPETCIGVMGKTHCDEAHGLDNSGGALLKAFASFNIFDQQTINDRLAQGEYGLVIHVRGYNGKANDTKVTLAVYVSNGVDGVQDGGAPAPKNDGTDRWTIDPGSLLGGNTVLGQDCNTNASACTPLYFDDNAYVADRVLVGRIDFPLTLGSGAHFGFVTMDLTGSVVTATLVPDGDTYRFDAGTVAGRWSTSKLLASLAVLKDPLSSAFLCGDNPTYQGIKTRICGEADIASDGKNDNTGARCDALSVGFGFTSFPAQLGQVFAVDPAPLGCSDAGPFADHCP